MSVSQNTGHPPTRTRAQDLLDSCRDAFVKAMAQGLGGVFENAIEKLYSEAETSGSSDVQSRCHGAARLLSRNEDRQAKRLKAGIARLFANPPKKPKQSDVDDGEESTLSLIEEDDLGESLALDEIINRAEIRFSSELFALNTRMSVLISGLTIDNDTNPAGPRAFCRLMAEGIEELGLEPPDRIIVYNEAMKPLLVAFARAYQEMNDLLAEAGILPNIKLKSSRGSERPAPTESDPGQEEPAPKPETENPPEDGGAAIRRPADSRAEQAHRLTEEMRADSKDVLDRIHGLMDRIHHRSGPPRHAGPSVPLQQLDSTIAGLQSEPAPATSQSVRERLLSSLRAAGKSVDPTHMRTIDLMGMVQDHIEQEIHASAAVKSLFAQLQLPLIRVALTDPSFFDNHDHPARQFFETVADASELWADDNSELADMWAIMKSAVSSATRQYDGDSSVFSELLDDLNSHVRQIKRRAQSLEKRSVAARQGQERLALARAAARRCIAELIEKYDPPAFPRTLMQKAWSDYLALCHMRGGDDDPDFKKAVSTAHFMAIAGSGKAPEKVAAQLLKKLPAVAQVLQKGLPKVGFGDNTAKAVVLHFRRTLGWSTTERDPEEKQPQWVGEEFEPESPAAVPEEPEVPLEPPPETEDVRSNPAIREEMELLRNTPFGTWFRLRDADGHWKRYKLSWFSPLSGNCLLISPLGRTREMALSDLARRLVSRDGERLREQHVPLFDRALRTIWRRLKKIAGVSDQSDGEEVADVDH